MNPATATSVSLHTFATSPYGLKVQAYLAFKGIAYETVYADPFRLRDILPVGHTVPVLTIDGESRNESQAIARWLDERFPECPLFPAEGGGRAAELDDWVQHCLIAANFKFAMPRLSVALAVQVANAWRLGSVMNRTIPDGAIGWKRVLWPVFLRAAPFIRREAARAPGDSLRETAKIVANRFGRELEEGPYLGGLRAPSVADLSAYAAIVPGYELGLTGGGALLRKRKVRAWARRVHEHLDPTLPLVPAHVRVNTFS